MATVTKTQASLRDVCREALAESEEPDPHELADEVLNELDEDQRDEAARIGVKHVLAEVTRDQRSRAARAKGERQGASPRYRRAAQTAERLPEIFKMRLHVGNDDGSQVWALLGDCGKAELLSAARLLDGNAAANARRAASYRTLASKLRGRQHVKRLPVAVVEEALST